MRPLLHLIGPMTAVLTATVSIAQDAYLASVDLPRYLRVDQNLFISGKVGNIGTVGITAFTVAWRWEQGHVFRARPVTLPAPGITGHDLALFTHNVPFGLVGPGSGTLHFWVEVDNDQDRTNDTVRIAITATDRWAMKHVLMELRTTLGDAVCEAERPRMDWLASDDRVVQVRYHHDDPFAVAPADKAFDRYAPGGVPACVLDAGEYGGYAVNGIADQWQAQLTGRLYGAAPVLLWVTADMEPSSREVEVIIHSRFIVPVTGRFLVKAMVLLNDVPVPGPGGTTVYHHHVVRGMLGDPEGQAEVVPVEPVIGTTYLVRYRFVLPESLDPDKICIAAALVHDNDEGSHALNATAAALRTVRTPGVAESTGRAPVPQHEHDMSWMAVLPERVLMVRRG